MTSDKGRSPPLQVLYRRRREAEFLIWHIRNTLRWKGEWTGKEDPYDLLRRLTWMVIDLDDEIRVRVYYP
jgi:hypothetical protein